VNASAAGVRVRKRFPIAPQHPERLCRGCDRYCAPDRMLGGNGSERAQHPVELFGADWLTFGLDDAAPEQPAPPLPRNPAAEW
jgi:hypothetical protein